MINKQKCKFSFLKHMKQPPQPVPQEERVQVVQAKAVNSAPNHDVIQVSAQGSEECEEWAHE